MTALGIKEYRIYDRLDGRFEITIRVDGTWIGYITDRNHNIRVFSTRSGARKAITREKRQSFHK